MVKIVMDVFLKGLIVKVLLIFVEKDKKNNLSFGVDSSIWLTAVTWITWSRMIVIMHGRYPNLPLIFYLFQRQTSQESHVSYCLHLLL